MAFSVTSDYNPHFLSGHENMDFSAQNDRAMDSDIDLDSYKEDADDDEMVEDFLVDYEQANADDQLMEEEDQTLYRQEDSAMLDDLEQNLISDIDIVDYAVDEQVLDLQDETSTNTGRNDDENDGAVNQELLPQSPATGVSAELLVESGDNTTIDAGVTQGETVLAENLQQNEAQSYDSLEAGDAEELPKADDGSHPDTLHANVTTESGELEIPPDQEATLSGSGATQTDQDNKVEDQQEASEIEPKDENTVGELDENVPEWPEEDDSEPFLNYEPLHRVIVSYDGWDTKAYLFPSENDAESDLFVLDDESLAYSTFSIMFAACREVIGCSREDCYLAFDFPALGVSITEHSPHASVQSMSSLTDLYVQLCFADGHEEIPPMEAVLQVRQELDTRLQILHEGLGLGKGLSQLRLVEFTDGAEYDHIEAAGADASINPVPEITSVFDDDKREPLEKLVGAEGVQEDPQDCATSNEKPGTVAEELLFGAEASLDGSGGESNPLDELTFDEYNQEAEPSKAADEPHTDLLTSNNEDQQEPEYLHIESSDSSTVQGDEMPTKRTTEEEGSTALSEYDSAKAASATNTASNVNQQILEGEKDQADDEYELDYDDDDEEEGSAPAIDPGHEEEHSNESATLEVAHIEDSTASHDDGNVDQEASHFDDNEGEDAGLLIFDDDDNEDNAPLTTAGTPTAAGDTPVTSPDYQAGATASNTSGHKRSRTETEVGVEADSSAKRAKAE